jgi:hypothetical protein
MEVSRGIQYKILNQKRKFKDPGAMSRYKNRAQRPGCKSSSKKRNNEFGMINEDNFLKYIYAHQLFKRSCLAHNLFILM